MALWGFAGLTPGGSGFNDYSSSTIPNSTDFLWRIQNSLDFAPFLFDSKTDIENIYIPYGLHWGEVDKLLDEDVFSKAAEAGITYLQPQVGKVISGTFDRDFPDGESWTAQVLHQHHHQTYQALVEAAYPT